MTNGLRPAAAEIIEGFKSCLDKSVCPQISNVQFRDLVLAIRAATSEASRLAATLLDEAARKFGASSQSLALGSQQCRLRVMLRRYTVGTQCTNVVPWPVLLIPVKGVG
jgi:hypothetical protein